VKYDQNNVPLCGEHWAEYITVDVPRLRAQKNLERTRNTPKPCKHCGAGETSYRERPVEGEGYKNYNREWLCAWCARNIGWYTTKTRGQKILAARERGVLAASGEVVRQVLGSEPEAEAVTDVCGECSWQSQKATGDEGMAWLRRARTRKLYRLNGRWLCMEHLLGNVLDKAPPSLLRAAGVSRETD
jgi:hypothetical protein|tara:strand:+ start:14223 stop:14783 length:561 start_codon:yes stop_codon:yes gene_type:complete